ncbi:MAG TPA: type II toxin-antitoxin system HicA family toxin [Verrucomicrobiae bacterium]|nr:type II toxin-antitoxin system HicA family toxin [Verrucomicrobiae bacterium]
MGKRNKLREKILLGNFDANIDFDDLCHLLRRWGFSERISGSHHIFSRNGIEEIINIQPKGRMTKSYQVAQIRDMILRYRIGEQIND